MKKVMLIRETPEAKSDGIDVNCQSIYEMFKSDKDIEILPIKNFKTKHLYFLKSRYLDRRDIEKAILKYEPDIIHIQGASTFTLFFSCKLGLKYRKRIFLSPHFHPFWGLKRPFMGKLFFYAITKPLLKHIDVVFTINNEDTAWFKKFHRNVIRIPHCSKYHQSFLKVEKKNNMILFVGRPNDSNKGIEHLYSLPEGKYDINIVGKGNIIHRSDIKHHENISNEELEKLYKTASLLVIPSRYEAFSYAALEALSCNTPIVVSERVRIIDYLENKPYVGVFRYGDMTSFVNAVEMTIGKNVDVEFVNHTFASPKIKSSYKNSYIS